MKVFYDHFTVMVPDSAAKVEINHGCDIRDTLMEIFRWLQRSQEYQRCEIAPEQGIKITMEKVE